MRFDIITIFPEIFQGALGSGILRRAALAGLVEIRVVNLRDFAADKHRSVDDRPYGGGEGMVFTPGPLFAAVEYCRGPVKTPESRVVLMTPQGRTWSQQFAESFSKLPHVVLICGRYEGIDQRVIDSLVEEEISIGDYVLTGGEIPALAVLDSVIRLLPGALGNSDSAVNESFSSGALDFPQYTRPAEFRGMAVPEVLLSGDHARIREWRRQQAEARTGSRRPDLAAGTRAGEA
ncbi:MAG: tRNA ((37)-N(1))-methyltransferase [Acidobacteria bacterium]|jgi:tRNA (guanine37-N1)-methyltransferase|nr:tRNA ((37)-N(1))-methyltransferase [Acidobacteriota bacterium]